MNDRPRALAVLFAIFLLGCILGAGGLYFWVRSLPTQTRRTVLRLPSGSPPEGRQRMQELLLLTPDQETQFGRIMEESRRQIDAVRYQDQPQIEAIFSKQQPKIESILNDANRKLLSILNKDQQRKFESLWKEMSNRRRGSPHGGRGVGPPPQ